MCQVLWYQIHVLGGYSDHGRGSSWVFFHSHRCEKRIIDGNALCGILLTRRFLAFIYKKSRGKCWVTRSMSCEVTQIMGGDLVGFFSIHIAVIKSNWWKCALQDSSDASLPSQKITGQVLRFQIHVLGGDLSHGRWSSWDILPSDSRSSDSILGKY